MKIRKVALWLFFLAALVVFPLHPASAQGAGIGLKVYGVDTTAFPTIALQLSAWNASGLPLTGLNTADFTLQEDGGAQIRPTRVDVDTQAPIWVALVMDISGSMQGQPLQDAKVAAARFLDRLGSGDQAALIAFSSPLDADPQKLNPQRELSFTADKTPLYNLIDSLQAGGDTLLYDAVSKAVSMFPDASAGHRAVLLLSDGANFPTDVGDPNQPIKLAQAANVPVYVIGLGSEIDPTYLQNLASSTGGLFRAAPTSAGLASIFGDMASLLKTQYQLTYQSQLPADGQAHALSLTLNTTGQTAAANISLGKLPLIPTQIPTLVPSPTLIPTEPSPTNPPTPVPTSTPLPTPTATPIPSFIQQASGSPWLWVGLVVIAGILMVIFGRPLRKPKPQPEVCAKCGFDMTGKSGACPQCGETRRLPKPNAQRL